MESVSTMFFSGKNIWVGKVRNAIKDFKNSSTSNIHFLLVGGGQGSVPIFWPCPPTLVQGVCFGGSTFSKENKKRGGVGPFFPES